MNWVRNVHITKLITRNKVTSPVTTGFALYLKANKIDNYIHYNYSIILNTIGLI